MISGDGVWAGGIERRGFWCFLDVEGGEGDGSELGFGLGFDLGVGTGDGVEVELGVPKKEVIWLCFRTRGERPLLRRRDIGRSFRVYEL